MRGDDDMVLRHTPLVPAERLNSPQSYRQLSRRAQYERFRGQLEGVIGNAAFASLCGELAAEGAVSLSGILPPARFDLFRQTYDGQMAAKGSRGALHSFLNVAASPPLLRDPGFWEIVADPLLVAVIAHALGGPVKLVDVRAKDTYPADVVARDNTLHLDNSPFIDEYKLVVTWTLGTTGGPAGQGLTYLPRTNRFFRQCFAAPDGSVWSDEDGCIFPSAERVDEVLSLQAGRLEEAGPVVVDLTDLEAPCHTVFAASRLVHQRYRTAAGAARSAIIASFHRTDESPEGIRSGEPGQSPLGRFLLGGGPPERFLASVRHELPRIASALERVGGQPGFLVDPRRHTLTGKDLDEWYERQRRGVTLNDLRAQGLAQNAARGASAAEWLVQRLRYDIQGPLNLPFFADMREWARKRARIRIRELSPEDLTEVVEAQWARSPRAATPVTEAGSGGQLAELRACLSELGRLLPTAAAGGSAGPVPTAAPAQDEESARSLPQFVADLGISAGWLAEVDADSVVTAAAFAVLASALASRWFALGAAGQGVTQRLLQLYLGLAGGVPDAGA